MENRIPKNRYNGSGINTEERKAQQYAQKKHDASNDEDVLEALEMEISAGSARVGLVVADIFTYLTKKCAMLPNMQLSTDKMRLVASGSGISFKIYCPELRNLTRDVPDADESEDYDDDEEGLLYDGD